MNGPTSDLLSTATQGSTDSSHMEAGPSAAAQPTLLSAESVEKANAKRASSSRSNSFSSEGIASSETSATVGGPSGTADPPALSAHGDESALSDHKAELATAAAFGGTALSAAGLPVDSKVGCVPEEAAEESGQAGQLSSAQGRQPEASAPDQATRAPVEGTSVADADQDASSAPAAKGANVAVSAVVGVGHSEQQPVHAQTQEPLVSLNTGNPFARGLSRPCSPVNAFAAHTRSRSMPSFLFDDPRPSSAPPFVGSPTAAAAAQVQATQAPDQDVPPQHAPGQHAPNQTSGAWLYQVQPSPGVWLEGTRARPVDVILSEVGAAAAGPIHARQQRQPERDIADRSGTSAADSLAPLPAHAAVTAAPAPADTLPAITEQGDQAASWDYCFPEAECTFPPQHSTSAEQTPGQLQRPLADFDCGFSTDMGAAASRQLPEAGPPTSGSAVAGGSSCSRGNPLPNQFTTAKQPPPGVPAWTEGTTNFPLLLPKREAPPPPLPPPAVSAVNPAWHSLLPAHDMGHHLRSLTELSSLSEGSEVGCEGPSVVAADDVALTWRPMRQADKDSCRRAGHTKQGRITGRLFLATRCTYQSKEGGHAKLGGVSREDAEMVHRELRLKEPFESVWALADWNAAERLSETQFMLFMFLLKMLKKGRPLPPRLGLTQARSLLHPRVSYLLGIPAEQLLPPATSMPQLLPWPELVPPTPELLPQPAVTGNEPLQDPATQLQAADRQVGNAPNVQAQPRQPSDLILRLAAGAKAAQQQAPDQAAASPEGVSLKQPLQAGAGGVRGRSPPLPAGSPSFWQPFGAGRAAGNPRPASAPSPTAVRAAAAAVGGPFGRGVPAPDQATRDIWRPFDGVPANGLRAQSHANGSGLFDTSTASDEEWQPFERAPVVNSNMDSNESQWRPDAWAADNGHPPVHAQSVPVSWGDAGARPPTRAASASAEGREQARILNGTGARRGNAQGLPPSGQQQARPQTADLLSTWPQRSSLREGIPSPRRASPAAPGSGATTPRSLSPDSHPPSHHPMTHHPPSHQPAGAVSLYKQPTLRSGPSAGGVRLLAITIERANLDYRKPLDRPVFCVSLHDADGRPLESPQDTPPGHFDRSGRCVGAGHTVILRTPMRQMPPEAVVYVELKHWKSASRKMSVLGWSFAPIETLVDASSPPDDPTPRAGQLFLHLWRKPLDLTAHQRRIQLKALHPHEHDLFLTIASA
ncbi:hypothetical protein COCSUDRAFT_58088 [Coccomyxa subellipsoidea C-169]|uniref:C2 Aida-type domain-containing protein n=1 Tax=Coccomyxa subellipsoidea (strain C-169) TaxID=574566 RepID=I0YN82_COCSC|nr:hypothetical protein COCSUDRAFT_58088 [Coccomyxa subellipsoidea C-169]EIE19851.1 hypothetical protein COCSUDRAFT_58088 [Coccomyxa subellipsoidea C-169]|eukprot:XP_005644395.1 hypothetical protein COCSUDRAFT_58088 [Coccomyxa subellipsoidea C-169]